MSKINLFWFGLLCKDDELCEYAVDYGFTINESQFYMLIHWKHTFHLLQYIHNNGISFNKNDARYIDTAIDNEQFDRAIFLHKQGYAMDGTHPIRCIQNITMEQFAYLFYNGFNTHRFFGYSAASAGRIDLLQFLLDHNYQFFDDTTLAFAFGSGNIECGTLLQEQLNLPLTASAYSRAALNGHLHVLQYLHTKNIPMNEAAAECACSGGHMDCFSFLINKGCLFNSEVCAQLAAENDHMIILQYLCQNNHDFNHVMCRQLSAYHASINCLRYLCEHMDSTDSSSDNHTSVENLRSYLDIAKMYGHRDVTKYYNSEECKEYLKERICAKELSGYNLI